MDVRSGFSDFGQLCCSSELPMLSRNSGQRSRWFRSNDGSRTWRGSFPSATIVVVTTSGSNHCMVRFLEMIHVAYHVTNGRLTLSRNEESWSLTSR